jgi:hypothetical protein
VLWEQEGHGRAGTATGDRQRDVAASGDGGTTWQGGEKPAGVERAVGSELEGQVVGLKRRG